MKHEILAPGIEIYLGDCLEVMKGMDDKSVDMLLTDPPYSLSSGGCGSDSGLRKSLEAQWGYDNKGDFFNVPEFDDWMSLAYETANNNAELLTMSNDKNLRDMLNSANNAGWKLHNLIVWDKQFKIANKWFMKQCEYILYFWKGKARNINDMGTANLFSYRPDNIGSKSHPSEKPVNLMKMLIENCTNLGDTILDPFAGSGTTAMVARKHGRKAIGLDLSFEYLNTNARERLVYGGFVPVGDGVNQLTLEIGREDK